MTTIFILSILSFLEQFNCKELKQEPPKIIVLVENEQEFDNIYIFKNSSGVTIQKIYIKYITTTKIKYEIKSLNNENEVCNHTCSGEAFLNQIEPKSLNLAEGVFSGLEFEDFSEAGEGMECSSTKISISKDKLEVVISRDWYNGCLPICEIVENSIMKLSNFGE